MYTILYEMKELLFQNLWSTTGALAVLIQNLWSTTGALAVLIQTLWSTTSALAVFIKLYKALIVR